MRKSPSEPDGIKRVQVGCGPHNIFDDWWNVDIRAFKGIDQVMDVSVDWPWVRCLDYVYGEHFLEHLTLPQALGFLVSAGNALQVGGRIRLSTPALEWVLKTHFTFSDDYNDVMGETCAVNRAFHGWGHQFLYSKVMLETMLVTLGYQSVQFFDYGHSNDPVLCNLERHGKWRIQAGYPSVWVVEAVRGEQEIICTGAFREQLWNRYLRYVDGGH